MSGVMIPQGEMSLFIASRPSWRFSPPCITTHVHNCSSSTPDQHFLHAITSVKVPGWRRYRMHSHRAPPGVRPTVVGAVHQSSLTRVGTKQQASLYHAVRILANRHRQGESPAACRFRAGNGLERVAAPALGMGLGGGGLPPLLSPPCLRLKALPHMRRSTRTAASAAEVAGNLPPEDDNDAPVFPRLSNIPRMVSRRVRMYFRKNPLRRAMFGGIFLFLGFYVAQTISLSLGALSQNDVVAAAICAIFVEGVTRYYHTLDKPTFPQALLNVFKMGFTYGLFIDAFKLAS